GKTFVALAIARIARKPLVVAPAALRDVWRSAGIRARVRMSFVSMESLSRRAAVAGDHDLVVIDEAHHLRTARTRRFAAACQLCRDARVLLLTATPVQNHLSDLRTILSLFLGERARAMPEEELARYIVRRAETDLSTTDSQLLPRVAEPRWLGPIDDTDCLDRLIALPPLVLPADGDDGGVLLTYTLLR